MGKILLATFVLFSVNSYAGFIQMFQYDAPLNTSYLQKVSVGGEDIFLEAAIMPCSHHPDFPKTFGDLYSCVTNRTQISALLNIDVSQMNDQALADWLLKQNVTFNCKTAVEPKREPYEGFTAFRFIGPVMGLN